MPLNFKRAVTFGVLWWAIAFITFSLLMFLPWIKSTQLRIMIAWWILEIPFTLLWAKAYFKADPPTLTKGVWLGIVALVVGAILDALITVPLFVHSYATFFGNWQMYVGYVIFWVLTIYAGGEFDKTYTKGTTM